MPLKLRKHKRSPNWYLRGTVRGIAVDESTEIPSRKAAEDILILCEAAVLERSIHGPRATATFLEAVAGYLGDGRSPRFIPRLVEHFGTTRLVHIDQRAIDDCAAKLYPRTGPATRARQVHAPTAAILHHAAKRGLCAYQPVERPRPPRGRIRWLKYDEAERLIAAAAPHLKPLLVFLFYTGARLGEALALEWGDVDLAARRVRLIKTKTGEPRGIPMHERVFEAMANLKHRDGKVFCRPGGRAYAVREHAGGQIKTAFKGACRRAGITDFTPHDCRHTWATWTYAARRDIGELMELGGWSSEAMVMRYAHVNPDHLTEAIAALPWEKSGERLPAPHVRR